MNVVEKEFDSLAAEYERNRLAGWYRAHADEMLKHCVELKSGDILDVGCGSGYFLRSYMKDRPGVRALGLDISSAMVAVAQQKAREDGLKDIKFMHADWESLDPDALEGYAFKVIICANTFHYFVEPQKATDKLFKQLANGGALYVLERNKARSLLTLIWGILHAVLIKDQVVFYTTAQLIQIFKRSGFEPVSALRSIKKYFWKNKLFTSLVLLECKKKH